MLNEIKIPTKEEIEEQLGKFLPTAEELEKLPEDEFRCWVRRAPSLIEERNKKRNPFPLLKEQISLVLKDESLTEERKETQISELIYQMNEEFNYRIMLY